MNTELLPAALLITALGMGLVFAAILLLWGLMELIVRLLPDRAEPEPPATPAIPIPDDGESLREQRRRAAVAAVAAALALDQLAATAAPAHDSSRWQDASRAQALQRMAGYYRPRPAAQPPTKKD